MFFLFLSFIFFIFAFKKGSLPGQLDFEQTSSEPLHFLFLVFVVVFSFPCFCFFFRCGSLQVARLLDSKGVGNITPEDIREALSSFGLEGEEAEDILIQVLSRNIKQNRKKNKKVS